MAADVIGKSGRDMLDALVAGETDPDVLAQLARRQMRKKIPALREALAGHFDAHHRLWIAESQNLGEALRWAVGEAAEPALELCAALGTYWLLRNRHPDVLEWTDRVLGLEGADAHPALCVRVLCIKAWCLWPLGRGDEQPAVTAEAESIATALADPVLLSQVLEIRAIHECAHLGHPDVADRLAVDALRWANIAQDDWTIAMAAYARAMAAEGAAALREHVDTAVVLLEQVGNVLHLADMLAGVAYSALLRGSDGEAREFIGRAIAVAEGLDHPFLQMIVRGNFALTSLLAGEIDAARRAFRDELRLCRELVVLPFAQEGLQGLAAIAAAHDDDSDRAARLAGAATAHRYGVPEDAVDARIEATFIEPIRIRIGTDAWGDAFQEGAALSFEEAIAYALDETSA